MVSNVSNCLELAKSEQYHLVKTEARYEAHSEKNTLHCEESFRDTWWMHNLDLFPRKCMLIKTRSWLTWTVYWRLYSHSEYKWWLALLFSCKCDISKLSNISICQWCYIKSGTCAYDWIMWLCISSIVSLPYDTVPRCRRLKTISFCVKVPTEKNEMLW